MDMKHSLPLAPQFYVTAPQPCPYLNNRIERKLFTGLNEINGEALNNTLSSQGFRRSQNVLYRPACIDVQHVYLPEYALTTLDCQNPKKEF